MRRKSRRPLDLLQGQGDSDLSAVPEEARGEDLAPDDAATFWLTVLTDGVRGYLLSQPEEVAWYNYSGPLYVGCFEWICDSLGYEPDWIRRKVEERRLRPVPEPAAPDLARFLAPVGRPGGGGWSDFNRRLTVGMEKLGIPAGCGRCGGAGGWEYKDGERKTKFWECSCRKPKKTASPPFTEKPSSKTSLCVAS